MHSPKAMPKHVGRDASRRRVPLIMGAMAVLLLVTGLLNQRNSGRIPLLQAQISDELAYWDTKVLRISISETFRDLAGVLKNGKQNAGHPTPGSGDRYTQQIMKYRLDAEEVQEHEREYEHELARTEFLARRLYIVEIFLGIALMVSSLAMLTRQGWFGYASLFLGFVGLVELISAFV